MNSANHYANKTLPSGIEHGPYPAYAEAEPDELQGYINRYGTTDWAQAGTSFDRFLEDRESEWQYDQHCAAAERAAEREDDPVSQEKFLFWINRVLRPLWVGSRTPREIKRARNR